MKRGLTKSDVEELEAKIPNRDVIAERGSLHKYVGSKEAIEEARFPWLRERRRARRRGA